MLCHPTRWSGNNRRNRSKNADTHSAVKFLTGGGQSKKKGGKVVNVLKRNKQAIKTVARRVAPKREPFRPPTPPDERRSQSPRKKAASKAGAKGKGKGRAAPPAAQDDAAPAPRGDFGIAGVAYAEPTVGAGPAAASRPAPSGAGGQGWASSATPTLPDIHQRAHSRGASVDVVHHPTEYHQAAQGSSDLRTSGRQSAVPQLPALGVAGLRSRQASPPGYGGAAQQQPGLPGAGAGAGAPLTALQAYRRDLDLQIAEKRLRKEREAQQAQQEAAWPGYRAPWGQQPGDPHVQQQRQQQQQPPPGFASGQAQPMPHAPPPTKQERLRQDLERQIAEKEARNAWSARDRGLGMAQQQQQQQAQAPQTPPPAVALTPQEQFRFDLEIQIAEKKARKEQEAQKEKDLQAKEEAEYRKMYAVPDAGTGAHQQAEPDPQQAEQQPTGQEQLAGAASATSTVQPSEAELLNAQLRASPIRDRAEITNAAKGGTFSLSNNKEERLQEERQERILNHTELLKRQLEELEREKQKKKEDAREAEVRDRQRVEREMKELAARVKEEDERDAAKKQAKLDKATALAEAMDAARAAAINARSERFRKHVNKASPQPESGGGGGGGGGPDVSQAMSPRPPSSEGASNAASTAAADGAAAGSGAAAASVQPHPPPAGTKRKANKRRSGIPRLSKVSLAAPAATRGGGNRSVAPPPAQGRGAQPPLPPDLDSFNSALKSALDHELKDIRASIVTLAATMGQAQPAGAEGPATGAGGAQAGAPPRPAPPAAEAPASRNPRQKRDRARLLNDAPTQDGQAPAAAAGTSGQPPLPAVSPSPQPPRVPSPPVPTIRHKMQSVSPAKPQQPPAGSSSADVDLAVNPFASPGGIDREPDMLMEPRSPTLVTTTAEVTSLDLLKVLAAARTGLSKKQQRLESDMQSGRHLLRQRGQMFAVNDMARQHASQHLPSSGERTELKS